MMRKIIQYIRQVIFLRIEKRKITQQGTLINAFQTKKVIFIHIPKTAGISLIRAVYGDVDFGGHRDYGFYNQIFFNDFNSYFTFSFVRNPWDRLYSAYKFLEKGGANVHDENAFDMYLSQYSNFKDFVMNGLSEELISEIIHFKLQSDFICDTNDNILVDFVGRFESLNDDRIELEKKINTNIELDHYNMNKKKKYTDIYTNEMILKVKHFYRRDINIFGYEF